MVIGFSKQFVDKILDGSKIHTIRHDQHGRWKAGMKMHMATGVRTPNYNCFKRQLCNGVQTIELFPKKREILIHNGIKTMVLLKHHHLFFAKNDGFASVDAFWEWFEKEGDHFIGKLIHWTDYRYL